MFSSRQGFTLVSGGLGNTAFFSSITSTSRYLQTTSTANLINVKNTTGFTLEYWIYPTSINNDGSFVANPGPGNHNGSNTNWWSFGPWSNTAVTNCLQFYYFQNTSPIGSKSIYTANNAIVANTWQNISVVTTTVSGNTTFNLYINGIRQQIRLDSGSFGNTVTIASNTINSNVSIPFTMGTYANESYIRGYVDEIRVSNVARYTGDSYTIVTYPFTSDSNTQLLINCDGANGSTSFTDSSSFNRTITNNSNLVTISNQVVI